MMKTLTIFALIAGYLCIKKSILEKQVTSKINGVV